jgi:hypothetical protein
VLFAAFADHLSLRLLPWLLFASGLFMGTVMGVVQVTVQNAAGIASLGSAVGSVQLSRSIGAGAGTALVGTVLFAAISLSDPETARLFMHLVENPESSIGGVLAVHQGPEAVVAGNISRAFRAAFLTVAAFAACGAVLAWSIPARRLT